MAYKSANYKPNEKSREILTQAWAHIESVDYKTTARWLFYRLLQDGFYGKKGDYKSRFLPLLSRARHSFYQGWRPDTLADDTREPIVRGNGYPSVDDWAESITHGIYCNLSHWPRQSHYVEVWFEAKAMSAQFRWHTKGITLRPFSGMPSIPYKWDIAKALEEARREWQLPITVLYFGDLDPMGELIPETSVADIRSWCKVNFDFVRAGLNPEDEVKYNIPENFEKPGTYQWEALEDTAAKGLIQDAVAQYVDSSVMAEIQKKAREAEDAFEKYVKDFSL